MNILNKVNKYLVEADQKNIRAKIMQFFKENPSPPDKKVHEFAESLGMDEHKFEEQIYSVLGSIFAAGKAFKNKFTEEDADPKELAMGVKVEMEHTTDAEIAKRIALDHLEEIEDYYTRLKKMEEEAGIKESVDEDFKKPCPKCGGTKFHRPGCPRLQATIRRESEREEAKRKAKGLPTSPNLGRK